MLSNVALWCSIDIPGKPKPVEMVSDCSVLPGQKRPATAQLLINVTLSIRPFLLLASYRGLYKHARSLPASLQRGLLTNSRLVPHLSCENLFCFVYYRPTDLFPGVVPIRLLS